MVGRAAQVEFGALVCVKIHGIPLPGEQQNRWQMDFHPPRISESPRYGINGVDPSAYLARFGSLGFPVVKLSVVKNRLRES
jgi:hypothetical protein